MDKEKILEKARNEKVDEGIENAKNKGLSFGYKVFIFLNIILIIFNLFMGQNSYDLMSLFWGFVGAEAYSRYKFSKEKVELISLIGSLMACAGFLACYIFLFF